MIKTKSFKYEISYAGLADIGSLRSTNQDEVILAPELGLFAVSDGMGGMSQGGTTSAYVKKAFPLVAETGIPHLKTSDSKGAARLLKEFVQLISDRLYEQGNSTGYYQYGATIAGVLLHGDKAVFVSLGDSRGYVLHKYKRNPVQVTEDMNVAGILVRAGKMTKKEALNHPTSSKLTAFIGMEAPATPDTFIVDIKPGDRILLCSDGLYGMVPEREIARIMRSSRNPETVCQKLIDAANSYGGRDNISVVYIEVR
jgi:Serine/threonine protein phosphatase